MSAGRAGKESAVTAVVSTFTLHENNKSHEAESGRRGFF